MNPFIKLRIIFFQLVILWICTFPVYAQSVREPGGPFLYKIIESKGIQSAVYRYQALKISGSRKICKVLGASIMDIVQVLNKDFLKLVALGFLIAIPITWYAMTQWLASFAYKIEIGLGIFLLTGILSLLIAVITVSWQSIRAAVNKVF